MRHYLLRGIFIPLDYIPVLIYSLKEAEVDPNVVNVKFMPSASKDLELIREESISLHNQVVTRCLYLKRDPIPDESEIVKCCDKKGYEIYRLKRAEFPSHRVLYAIDEEKNTIVIFGIMPRSVDYNPDSDFMRRIIDDYIAYFGGDTYVFR